MSLNPHSFFKKYLHLDEHESRKLLLLMSSFFFIIASYSILRSLKAPLFLAFVGKELKPISRLISLFTIFPVGLAYSKLVDSTKRQNIVYIILGLYGICSLIFAILFAHPVIGVKNTMTHPWRLVGWCFEIFMDLYSAIVVSTFWGFINSICTREFASKTYGCIVAASRLGGMCATLGCKTVVQTFMLSAHQYIPIITGIAAAALLASILCVAYMIKTVPSAYLGLSANTTTTTQHQNTGAKPGVFEGIKLILAQPYVFGIFCLVYGIEFIQIIFDYQREVLLSIEMHNNIGSMTEFDLGYTASFQVLGLFFALFGTTTLLNKMGTSFCLLVSPIIIMGLSAYMFYMPTLTSVALIMVAMRALNFGFNDPVLQTLYIPTTKSVQFKAKVWIDSMGKTLSKTSGSLFNHLTLALGTTYVSAWASMIGFSVAATYTVVAFFVGKTYNSVIKNKTIIGNE